MQYHSTEHLERHEEFRRMLILAAQGTSQLLIVSPDKIDTLEDYLKASFQEAPARKLRKEKSLKINDSLTVFLKPKILTQASQEGTFSSLGLPCTQWTAP